MRPVHGITLLLFGFVPAEFLSAQSNSVLPATPTTANSMPAPISASSSSTRDFRARHRAHITYVGGLLNVRADNSSLNGILHDISVATGMKVNGGVADQRVFGNYGPAEPGTVLATLLDGTGTNMLLRETADNGPRELVLTPRTGGVTPPSPSAQNYDGEEGAEEAQQTQQQQARTSARTGANWFQSAAAVWAAKHSATLQQCFRKPNNTTQTVSTLPTVQSVPSDSISTPSVAPPVSGIVDSTNPPPPGSTTFGSSTPTNTDNLGNGTAKTPEQIFQQLQQMRQQSQQQQQSGTGSTTPK